MGLLSVTFGDTVALVVAALTQALPGVVVSIVKPAAMAGKKVVIVRATGGGERGLVLRAQNLSFTVFAPTEPVATALAEQVVALVSALGNTPGSGVSYVAFGSAPSPVVDDSLIPCRFSTCQIYVRGT